MSTDQLTTGNSTPQSNMQVSIIETNKSSNLGKVEGQETADQHELMKKLQDQLVQARAENESQKRIMESHLLQFQKDRDSWLIREKELLDGTSSPAVMSKEGEQRDVQQLESALKSNQEELKNVKEDLQKAQDKIKSLELSSKDSGNTGRDHKQGKRQGDKNPPPPPPSGTEVEQGLRKDNEKLRAALTTAVARLKDKTMQATSLEQQNVQLRAQVISLKEVTSITKDLLGIRNSEVEHLRGEMEAVEAKIQAERDQRAQAIQRVEKATQLNASLKREYEIQLSTFKKLRSKYEEKVELLASENRRLVAEAMAEGRPGVVLDVGPLTIDDEEMPQH